jgi:hypothetical protein
VNSGGSPDRDDFGLPPIDVEIPDDARELDREVQAYHRELRMLRRRRFVQRVFAPLVRRGLVMPLVASCLALTLLAGTLLTMFTAGQAAWGPAPAPRRTAGGHATAARRTSQPVSSQGRAGQPLPAADILLDGLQTPLGSLAPAVLALVPPGCGCTAALRGLVRQASTARVNLFLVGVAGTPVSALAQQIGLPASQAGEDTGSALAAAYRPTALTAVLVRRSGLVAAIIQARHGSLVLGGKLALVSGSQHG